MDVIGRNYILITSGCNREALSSVLKCKKKQVFVICVKISLDIQVMKLTTRACF